MEPALPLVSILIPNYNYANYILGAVVSADAQTYANIEIIILDDNSKDNSVEVIESWIKNYRGNRSIRLEKNEQNMGLGGACNKLLGLAKGKYFQTLDADDIIYPDKISTQVSILENDPEAALVFSDAKILDSEGNFTGEHYLERIGYNNKVPQINIFSELYKFNFVPLPTVLVSTEIARQVGGFNSKYQVQDYGLWLKLATRYKLLFHNELLAGYRVHKQSMSKAAHSSAISTSHILHIKFEKYPELGETERKVFRKNLYNSIPTLIKYYPAAAYDWAKINLKLNLGIKAFYYFLFSFFLKKMHRHG